MSKVAHIIAVKAASIAGWAGLGFGIKPMDAAGEQTLFVEGEVWIGPRPVLEEDPTFVQPIPYIVVRKGEQLLSYIRSPKGGESRLHSKVAVGFGGHVDLADAVLFDDGRIDLRATMMVAAGRELEEELGIKLPEGFIQANPDMFSWTHLIQANATPVDCVHVGLVVSIDIEKLQENPDAAFDFEDTVKNARFMTPAELAAEDAIEGDARLEMETWTGLVVRDLISQAA